MVIDYDVIGSKFYGNKKNVFIDKMEECIIVWFQGFDCYLFFVLFYKLNFSIVVILLENCLVNGLMEIKKIDFSQILVFVIFD